MPATTMNITANQGIVIFRPHIGTAVPSRDIPRFIQLYQRGRLPVDRLMSGTLTLDEINLGFDRLHDGSAIRQVVTL